VRRSLLPAAAAAEPATPATPEAKFAAEQKDGVLTLRAAGRVVLRYRATPGGMPEGYEPAFLRGGYIAEVYTPAGTLVTDDYPARPQASPRHLVPVDEDRVPGRKPDFWNMGNKTGTVEPVSLEDVHADDSSARFRAKHRMVDLTATPEAAAALDETWDVTVHPPTKIGNQPAHVFDLVITQTTASRQPARPPQVPLRRPRLPRAPPVEGPDGTRFLTSEGKTRLNGNETRAKWTHVGGDVDGEPAGIAILCHPDNFRFPQPVRLHPDRAVLLLRPVPTRRLEDRTRQAVRREVPLRRQRRHAGREGHRSDVGGVREGSRRQAGGVMGG
jgi:hypothetical protein